MAITDLISEGKKEYLKEFSGTQRKVLLAGGGGYIGLVIANKLLTENFKVVILDNYIYNHEIASLNFPAHKNLEFINHDLRDPLSEDYMEGVTDVVILAGLVGDPITKSYPLVSDQINGSGIRLFIKNLNQFNLNKVIFVSTCSNYGMIKEDDLADENFELNPLSLYAKEKVVNEEFILNLEDIDYSPTVLKFETAFGSAPRMRFDLTVNEFVLNILRKKLWMFMIRIHGDHTAMLKTLET